MDDRTVLSRGGNKIAENRRDGTVDGYDICSTALSAAELSALQQLVGQQPERQQIG
jgi:hypothetical protein